MEAGRADLTLGKPASPVGNFKIALTHADGTHGTLNIAWQNVAASVPFTVK